MAVQFQYLFQGLRTLVVRSGIEKAVLTSLGQVIKRDFSQMKIDDAMAWVAKEILADVTGNMLITVAQSIAQHSDDLRPTEIVRQFSSASNMREISAAAAQLLAESDAENRELRHEVTGDGDDETVAGIDTDDYLAVAEVAQVRSDRVQLGADLLGLSIDQYRDFWELFSSHEEVDFEIASRRSRS